MKKILILTLVFLCGLSSAVCVAEDLLVTKKQILDNGLTAVVTEIPSSSLVSVYGLVKTGSATEGRYLGAGLSHFMEHMLFKGTQRRAAGDIPKEIQSLGGTINASTSFDYTIYTITVPRQHAAQAADILSDMLMHAKFDPEELESEREVVFSEMRLYRDRPDYRLNELVQRTAYQQHPYRLPIIGFRDLLAPLSREDFLDYYHARYAPNNMVISVAGGIDAASGFALIADAFGSYPRGPYTLRDLPHEPNQFSPRVYEEYYSTQLTRVSLSYPGVSILDADMPALDALAVILGQGRGSRLYQALIEREKAVQSVTASNFTPQDAGLFEIEFTFEQGEIDRVVSLIDAQIAQIQARGIEPAELEKVVNTSLKQVFMEQETSAGMAYRTAMDEAWTGDPNFTQSYIRAFAELTPQDIRDAARRYLNVQKRSIVILRPRQQEPDLPVSSQDVSAAGINRHELENGLIVLTREDHQLPLVWINLVLNGGLYAEPADLNGISSFMSDLWTKGTRKYSALDIARLTERRGLSVSGFSGNNSFGLRVNCLSKDLDFAVSLLADMILEPSFPPEQFDIQKQRTLTAIVARQDDIRTVGLMAAGEMLFNNHPLGRTGLGTEPSVSRIRREDIRDFYQRNVAPSNAVLSVFGDVDTESVLSVIRNRLKQWKNRDPDVPSHVLSRLTTAQTKRMFLDKEQAAVILGFRGESFYHEDRYGLEVLSALIGYPFQGRMFSVIRDEKGLAYTLGGGYTPARDSGEMKFFVLTAPESVAQVQEELKSLIIDLTQNGPSEDELHGMKQYLIGRFQRSIEGNGGVSFMTALDELYGLGYRDYENYTARIEAVTAQDIRRLAQIYFNLGHAAWVTVLPDSAKDVTK